MEIEEGEKRKRKRKRKKGKEREEGKMQGKAISLDGNYSDNS